MVIVIGLLEMRIEIVLVLMVAILSLVTGFVVLFGANKESRSLSWMFFFAALGSAVWGATIAGFMMLPEGNESLAEILVIGTYISGILVVLAAFGFAARFTKYKVGKILMTIFAVGALALSGMILLQPGLLFRDILTLARETNTVILRSDGWLNICYIGFFVAVMVAYSGLLIAKIMESRKDHSKESTDTKKVCQLLLFGMGMAGIISLFTNLLLTTERYDLVWVGPLTIGIVIMSYYYAILRYKLIMVKATWMKVMSYLIFIATMALIYVTLLVAMSIVLFERTYIPVQDLVLNFVMIAIVFLMMPVFMELMSTVRSMLSINSIDIGYIAKQLRRMDASEEKLKELAMLLADHLHLSYVGIVVGDKLHGSKQTEFGLTEVEIEAVGWKNAPEQIWKRLRGEADMAEAEYADMCAISELRGVEGMPYGKVVLGTPHSQKLLDEEDCMRMEMVLSLVATTIDPSKG